MCDHLKHLYSSNINSASKAVVVKCGRCPSCLQEKADKYAQRIRFETMFLKPTELAVMVTLTYNNASVPYVNLSSVCDDYITVYRNSKPIQTFRNNETNNINFFDVHEFLPGKVAVSLFKDIQDFQKRFRISQLRKYGRLLFKSYYQCSEYGNNPEKGATFRPHFHLLFRIENSDFHIFKNSIMQNWTYCNYDFLPRWFEVAVNPSNYVASYINEFADLPLFLKQKCFAPKRSFSQNFGFNTDFFQLPNILDNYKKGIFDVSYTYRTNGKINTITFPLPKYVKDRFFPRIKGFSQYNDSALQLLYLQPRFNTRKFEQTKRFLESNNLNNIDYNAKLLENAYSRFWLPLGFSRYDFSYLIPSFYRRLSSNNLFKNLTQFPNDYDFVNSVPVYLKSDYRYRRHLSLLLKYTDNFKHKKLNSLINS